MVDSAAIRTFEEKFQHNRTCRHSFSLAVRAHAFARLPSTPQSQLFRFAIGRFSFIRSTRLRRAGITDITLSLSYQPNKIEQLLGDGSDYGVKLKYTVEPQPMGTAGAYKFAEDLIREPTVVFNGDILTDLDLKAVIREHNEHQATATIVLTPVDNPSSYGLVETESDGRIRRFLEKPKPEEITCNTINAGTYILEPKVLDFIPSGENHSFEYGFFRSC